MTPFAELLMSFSTKYFCLKLIASLSITSSVVNWTLSFISFESSTFWFKCIFLSFDWLSSEWSELYPSSDLKEALRSSSILCNTVHQQSLFSLKMKKMEVFLLIIWCSKSASSNSEAKYKIEISAFSSTNSSGRFLHCVALSPWKSSLNSSLPQVQSCWRTPNQGQELRQRLSIKYF